MGSTLRLADRVYPYALPGRSRRVFPWHRTGPAVRLNPIRPYCRIHLSRRQMGRVSGAFASQSIPYRTRIDTRTLSHTHPYTRPLGRPLTRTHSYIRPHARRNPICARVLLTLPTPAPTPSSAELCRKPGLNCKSACRATLLCAALPIWANAALASPSP